MLIAFLKNPFGSHDEIAKQQLCNEKLVRSENRIAGEINPKSA